MLVAICAFILGLLIGGFIMAKIFRNKYLHPLGVIRVDHSDPYEAPYLFLELESSPEVIMQQEYAMFQVLVKDYISHE